MAHFNSYKKILKSLLIVFLLSSCTTIIDWDKQIDTLINGQSYVIPIGETTLTLNDIITQLDTIHLLEPGENYIFIKYNDTIVWDFKQIADLQNLGQWSEEVTFNGVTIPFANKTVEKDFPHTINFDFNSDINDQNVVESKMKSAKVEITVDTVNLNIDPSNIVITTLFNSNELIFDLGGDVAKGAGSVFVFEPTVFGSPKVITLNPFTLFTPNNLSAINLTVKVEVKAGITPIILNPNSKISLTYRLFDVDPKVFFGKFKPVIATNSQEKTVDMTPYIMQLPPSGIFKLAEPIITMNLLNNSGLKMNFSIDSIRADRQNDPSFAPVYAQFNGSKSTTKIVDRIPAYGGDTAKTTFVLDHTLANGDISHFFDRFPLPDRIMYKFKLSNARVDSDPLDFMTPQGNITAHIGVKVPLKLNAGSSFILVDTLENIDMESLIDLQVVDQMMLVLKVTNNLPLKGKLSLLFLDENKLPINDLQVLVDSDIKAPQIDDDGLVVSGQSVDSDLKVIVANSQLTKLRLAKNLVYMIKVESEDNRKITLQKENFIKLKLGKYSQAD